MNTKRPEALRIAEWLAGIRGNTWPSYIPQEAAQELRRQHAEIEALRAGYSAARLEIESLQKAATGRHTLQATGAHCARYCEAQAFRITLRNLHAEIERLRTCNKDAQHEIANLQERVQQLGQLARDVNSRRVTELEAQLAAVGAGGVESLRKRECLHQISEPAQAMLAHFLEKEAPRIDAAGLDAERHCCEHTLYLERERLHAAIAAQKENHD